MQRRWSARGIGAGLVGATLAFALPNCGDGSVPSPFARPDAGDAGDATTDGALDGPADAPREDGDAPVGEPCLDESQCDDGVECTLDRCPASTGRCEHLPDDARCADGVHCDGAERCDRRLGCRDGDPIDCSDGLTCTIDRCIEATRSCASEPRDADGDGHQVWNCRGGTDCDDDDPEVNPDVPEICGNAKDDDCDGKADAEAPSCVAPEYDTCVDALLVEGDADLQLSLAGAGADYGAGCGFAGYRDVVLAVRVPPGPNVDVDVLTRAGSGLLGLSTAEPCGSTPAPEDCAPSASSRNGGPAARTRLRSVAPGTYPVVVAGSPATDVSARVRFTEASEKPDWETCGTARALLPDVPETVSLIDATRDAQSACGSGTGELVYRFDLDRAHDVTLRAASVDGVGDPVLGLRRDCSATGERSCRSGAPAVIFARALQPGAHYVSLAATAPSDLVLTLSLAEPSTAPVDESCSSAPLLEPGRTTLVPLAAHVDDHTSSCATGLPDAAYELALPVRSDVLLLQRIANGDTGSIALLRPGCAAQDLIGCAVGTRSPVRLVQRGVAAGSRRVLVESGFAGDVAVTAFTRPAVPSTLVAFADTCAEALRIPEQGGSFEGNTANANADTPVRCDLSGQGPRGAPDQFLRLELSERRRVIFDMKESSFSTLLAVRRGPDCPGADVPDACAAGYVTDRSFLDLVLDPGVWIVHVDGYAGASGAWKLDVFTSPP